MKKLDIRKLAEQFGTLIVAGVERAAKDVKEHPERGKAVLIIQTDVQGGILLSADVLRLTEKDGEVLRAGRVPESVYLNGDPVDGTVLEALINEGPRGRPPSSKAETPFRRRATEKSRPPPKDPPPTPRRRPPTRRKRPR